MSDLRLDHIECADALTYLRTLPDESVNCCITSPPYFNLRSYLPTGHEDKAQEVGTEDTPAAYVARLVAVFEEVRRVLRPDGSVFCNLGDSYGENKQLQLIPHRFAIAMQDAGWICRQDIVWHKPAPMPESVRDRCTRAHEYIFHFVKQPRYWYDAAAVSEPVVRTWDATNGGNLSPNGVHKANGAYRERGGDYPMPRADGLRNRRSVWTVNTAGYAGAHFATFPEKLVEPMVLAGCPEWVCEACGAPYEAQVDTGELVPPASRPDAMQTTGNSQDSQMQKGGAKACYSRERTLNGYAPSCSCNAGKRSGVTLDPFSGAGTVALVAKRLNRRYVGCDLNPAYVDMARARVDGISYSLWSLAEGGAV